ncbi:MAG: TylF/MycF/NovP-related O-methyltransferase [Planctomycetota bacterium]
MPSTPKPKFVPTRWYEYRRLLQDRKIDRALETEAGRREYWERTLPGQCASDSMIALLEGSLALPGDVIECGVYRGTSLMKIARVMTEHAPDKTLYACDSFGGFPEDRVETVDVGRKRSFASVQRKFRFCSDTPGRIGKRFQQFGVRGEIVPGFFSETLGRFREHTFCFVHLDVDLYASYMDCLGALYDRVAPGGVVVFDECDSSVWPGSLRALREFFAGRAEVVQICLDRDLVSYYVQKPAAAVSQAA